MSTEATSETQDTVLNRLNAADQALTNLEDCDGLRPDTEAFESAIEASRASINSARAQVLAQPH